MTLGATKQDVLRRVLGQGLRLMIFGVGVGLVLSFVLTRFLSSLPLGVTGTDTMTFLTVVLLLCAVALFPLLHPRTLGHASRAAGKGGSLSRSSTAQKANRNANCMKRGVVRVERYLPNCDGS
ncbi:MAG: hypothetical protein JOZ14_04015 [Acidobacteria bacterium]|nr:hypothetical protein [Acidobacteriota bacterium]